MNKLKYKYADIKDDRPRTGDVLKTALLGTHTHKDLLDKIDNRKLMDTFIEKTLIKP